MEGPRINTLRDNALRIYTSISNINLQGFYFFSFIFIISLGLSFLVPNNIKKITVYLRLYIIVPK